MPFSEYVINYRLPVLFLRILSVIILTREVVCVAIEILIAWFAPPCGRGCFRPAAQRAGRTLRSSVSSDDFHLKNIFEDNGEPGQHVNDMFERDVFQRCLSAQLARPTALQRFNRRKSALQDLAATADLPPHSVLFSQQLLDLTHRWWSEAEDPDIDVNDVCSLAAAAYICIKRQPASPVPFFSFQTPSSQPTFPPLFSTGASLTTFGCCVQPRQSTKSSLKNIASWSQ